MHHDAGRYTEAVAFYGAALAIRERLDPDHPELAAVLEDLAAARQDEGESAESETLMARANQIRQARRSIAESNPPARDV
jgi:hypothetical protein